MDADAFHAIAQVGQAQGIVHFGGRFVVNGKGGNVGFGQVGHFRKRKVGETCSFGEIFDFKPVLQVLGNGRNAARFFRQFVGGGFQCIGSFGKGFVGQRLLVGCVQDGFQIRRDFRRHLAAFQGFCPSVDLRVLLFFAFDGGKRLFQSFFGGGFEHAFGFFVEIHRRGVKRNQSRRQLGFGRRMAVIFFGDGFGGKFLFAAYFPQ